MRPRTNTFNAVFRVRSLLSFAIHKFFQENNFVYVHTPIITGSDAEGAGEMFQVTTLSMEKIAEIGIIPSIPKQVAGIDRSHYTQKDTICTEGALRARCTFAGFRSFRCSDFSCPRFGSAHITWKVGARMCRSGEHSTSPETAAYYSARLLFAADLYGIC